MIFNILQVLWSGWVLHQVFTLALCSLSGVWGGSHHAWEQGPRKGGGQGMCGLAESRPALPSMPLNPSQCWMPFPTPALWKGRGHGFQVWDVGDHAHGVGLGILNPCHHAWSSVASARALQPRTRTLKGRFWQTCIPDLPHGICSLSEFLRLSSSQSFYLSVLGREEVVTRKVFFLQVMSCHFLVTNWYQFVCACARMRVCSRVLLK